MTKPANLLAGLGVFLVGFFFKSANKQHRAKPLAFYVAVRGY